MPWRPAIKANLKAEELFDDFLNTMDENKFSSKKIETRNAIQLTFSKLHYILKLMSASHKKAAREMEEFGRKKSKPYFGLDQDFVGQTQVHAESFYCEAFRLKKALEKFGIKSNFRTLTFVRNHIVEHPAVDKIASSWSPSFGPKLYVGLKPIVAKHPEIKDRGFYPNAMEFYGELNKSLEKAIPSTAK